MMRLSSARPPLARPLAAAALAALGLALPAAAQTPDPAPGRSADKSALGQPGALASAAPLSQGRIAAPPRPGLSDSPPGPAEILRAELRPGWREADGRHFAALRLELAPHWKTYWRAPGDAGIPPEFDWSGSQNLAGLRIHWPSPEVFDFQGMQTIGYRHEVILPVEITPRDPAAPVTLNASVALGLCNDICMPATLALDLALPDRGAPDPLIAGALAAQPRPAVEAGLAGLRCRVDPIEDGLRITALFDMPQLAATEKVVFEPDHPVWVSDATVTRQGRALMAVADVVPPPGAPVFVDMARLRLTVLDAAGPARAVEVTGCPVN